MNLFVYGTLRSWALWDAVGGQKVASSDAVLPGYAVRCVSGDVVPTIYRSAGAAAEGRLLHDVPDSARARLDLYEGAWGYTLTPVEVQTETGPVAAEVYLPPAEQATRDAPWSFAAWQTQNEAAATLAAQEVFARDPWPSPAQLRVMLPMAEKRAWARLRAQNRCAPATVRADHNLQDSPDLARLDAVDAPRGNFFAMQASSVSHARFDGTRNSALPREVFLGIDAALVLPYDPGTDTVLLVEQMRMGPLMLGEPNPWVLEPIAGMVDARETPEEAALREAQEEAGLTDLTLEKMFSFYASPGAATEYHYCYVARAQLGPPRNYLGGLADEHEDLRLHILPFDQLMPLAESGEINAGPLLAMVYWLAAHRDRLRA